MSNKYLEKIASALADRLRDHGDAYLFHGSADPDLVKKEGLRREAAWERSRDATMYQAFNKTPEDYRFSLSSIQGYSKAYTPDHASAPLLIRVRRDALKDMTVPGLRWLLNADEFHYSADVPPEDILSADQDEYHRVIKNHAYLKADPSLQPGRKYK